MSEPKNEVPEKKFVQVCWKHPTDGANSGTLGCNEQPESVWLEHLNPKYDQDLLSWMSTAQVGQYMDARGRVFFRAV